MEMVSQIIPFPAARRAAAPSRATPDPSAARMARLAFAFPSLRGAPGIEPWDPSILDHWADQQRRSSSERHAARFLLAVWDGFAEWRCGRFDAMAAVSVWDPVHRGAFLTWAAKPWNP